MQALAQQSDRFVRNGDGGFRRLSAGDDDLNDHESIGSVRCVVGEAGIDQEIILADLEKAVKAVGSVVTGGHLSFQHCLRQAALVGGAEAAPDGKVTNGIFSPRVSYGARFVRPAAPRLRGSAA